MWGRRADRRRGRIAAGNLPGNGTVQFFIIMTFTMERPPAMRTPLCALLGLCLAAAPALGQTAFRVKDIRTAGTAGTDTWPWGAEFMTIGPTTYFNVSDGVHGGELWASDGTSAGTRLVKDICPGICASTPRNLAVAGGLLYFAADDGSHGVELWKSDGSAAGTVLVADLVPGLAGSGPFFLTEVGGRLLFAATTLATGSELWATDGTAAGTALVADIEPGPGGSTPEFLGRAGGLTCWSASDSPHGRELWVSDGTPAGTHLVADLRPGGADAIPYSGFAAYPGLGFAATLGNRLLFIADDGTAGTELWASDGTAAGTVRVKDIAPGAAASTPFAFRVLGSTLFFDATDSTAGAELWKSDGTEAGTVRVADINPGPFGSSPRELAATGTLIFFRADDGTHGSELWKSDGTEAGTVLVKDIQPGLGNGVSAFQRDVLTALGDTLLFFASDGVTGTELWKSDGTEAGTVRLADFNPGPGGSFAPDIFGVDRPAVANGRWFFRAATPTDGLEVYVSDGTAAGSGLLKEIDTQSSAFPVLWTGDLFASPFVDRAGSLVFTADDGATGLEPWKSDGTAGGTAQITDLNPGVADSAPLGLATLGGTVLMNATAGVGGRELYGTDGTAGGTGLVKDFDPGSSSGGDPQQLIPFAGKIYFEAPRPSDPGAGVELWKSDGTPAGTVPVVDPFPADGPRPGDALVPMGSRLYFAATTAAAGTELWASDGTAAGTVQVKDMQPGAGAGFPRQLAATATRLFFSADDGSTGREPWVSDGTPAGTFRLKDIAPGAAGGLPDDDALILGIGWNGARAATANGLYFFVADDGTTGQELWKSDGTPAGTVLLKDIRPGALGSEPRALIGVGRKVFFVAADGTAGRELWVSDGTATGTVRVADIAPGAESSLPQQLTAVGNQLLFSAHDAAHGRELWRSGGTAATTVRLTDLAPGPLPSSPLRFTASGAYVYFAATDGTEGFELHALPRAALGTAFYTLPPCRAVDTRNGSPLQSGIARTFALAGSCGIPATAKAVALNLTAVAPQGGGFLTAYPAGSPTPPTSTLNLQAGRTLANNATLPLGGGGLEVLTSVGGGGQVHLLVDVVGYFQ
jgi:ELWxxDGT repeat protein